MIDPKDMLLIVTILTADRPPETSLMITSAEACRATASLFKWEDRPLKGPLMIVQCKEIPQKRNMMQ